MLTAHQDRLREMTTMLHYGGIDFEPHHGPDVWSKEYVELTARFIQMAMPKKHRQATMVLRNGNTSFDGDTYSLVS